ncbi:S8 family serine peptidase [Arthrobacter oryzae]|uniref:S8 family serine peptidase n=1 Tax=Arthrobacter oryzae TaxID=409290 RepID=UPI002859CF76|nr:S8 family serine peptidase [Arthrobacter oryzae]MDR6505119.1 serine protease [Arthrobacter oryzae]
MSHALRTRLSARLLIPGVLALVCGSVVSLPAAADDAPVLPVAPAVPAVSQTSTTDQFIVKFKDTAPAGPALRTESLGKVARNVGVLVTDIRGTASGARVLRAERRLDAVETEKALAALRGDPAVEHAEPDIRMYPTAEPNDPYYPLQWGLLSGGWAGSMNMPGAWSLNRGAGAVVAVVDTGITSHPELNASVLAGYDMMSDPADSRDSGGRDANPRDEGDWTTAGMCGDGAPASPSSWHGTQVAGIIAAAANNSSGITGVAPEAKILPVRALGPCGGYMSDIADGIIWAAGGPVAGLPVNPNPARVINLSLGGDVPCPATFQSAVNFAYESGAAVIAAAGNENRPAAETSPSNCQNVISVAALTRTGNLAPYSNYGPAVDVAAPGGDVSQASSDGILVAFNQGTQGPGAGTYAYSSGTSMAAPHASGLAALLMSRLGDLATPDNVEARLKVTSTNGSACVTKTCGSGLLQGTAALNFQPDREIKGVPPIIGGKAAVGQDLSAYAINWTPSDVTFSYQWNRNGAPIQGAQATTYLPQPADVGTTLTVTATGSRFFGQSVSVTSEPTAPVEAATVVPPYDPFITGLGIVGGTVTAYTGTWQPAPVTLSFQWYRAGAVIPGATASTYTPAEEDKGTILTVRVTGTKDGYITVQRTSAAKTISTGVVPAPVQFTDRIGSANDTYTVPTTAGVEYMIGGKVVPAGTYPGVGYVLVSAKPMQGYALAGGPPGWEFVFDSSFFRDITDGSAFALEINWLATEEITQGWAEPDGKRTFRSAEPVNRDQMAAFLYRLAGNPDFVPPAVSPFADIPTNHAFYREISWLAAKHISTGWKEEDGTRTFRPGATVNRDQMAAFIYRHAGSPDYVPEAQSRFVDIPTDHGFYKEISWLAKMGISNGWAESATTRSFRPGASILRDQMAAFMYRYAATD